MAQRKQTKKRGISAVKMVAIGTGVASLGAGAYYLLGPNGKKHQKKATVWMKQMEKELMKKVSTLKSSGKPLYDKTIDALAITYSKQYAEHAPEIKSFAKELKGKWEDTKKTTKNTVKSPIKKIKRLATNKIVKKIVEDPAK